METLPHSHDVQTCACGGSHEEAAEPSSFELAVSYRGAALHVTVSPADPLRDLKDRLAEITEIEPENQKLSLRGKLLGRDRDAESLGSVLGLLDTAKPPKLLLIGTSSKSIAEIQETSRRYHATLANRAKFLATARDTSDAKIRTISSESEQHIFLRTSVLPSPPYPNPHGAQAILDRIRADPGIRHLMSTHKFTIGLLSELSPFERTILGFNKNKGQEISLRLRTDDLSGFRSYGSIRKVLIHELTHCVWSEHDVNFNTLNSQLTRELVAYERSLTAAGKTLGGMEYDYGDADTLSEQGEIIDSHGYKGNEVEGFKAGGSAEWRERERELEKREVLRMAAERRMGKGESSRENRSDGKG